MEHGAVLKDVPIGAVILRGNSLWKVESKGLAPLGFERARLQAFKPPPRGWTTDYVSAGLTAEVSVLTPEEAEAWRPTTGKLIIEIDLGNELMQSASDAASAIHTALIRQSASALDPLNAHEMGAIRDGNGNTVGKWEVV